MEALLSPGQVFADRYRVERLLAHGGFGAVYVAEQIATEARVALKVLWPHVLQSDTAVTSFQQEARIAGRVHSEHIVRVLDAGFDAGSAMPFLVMELLEGRDLERVVEQSGPLSPELMLITMGQAASALDKAHAYVDRDGTPRPIVHRDLKPENLFLTSRENGEPMVKILDFGIAKVMSATAKVSHEVKGTPLYMAYEQASGGAITPRTDVWALGLIVFFLLTGRNYWRTAASEEASLTQLFGEVLGLPILPASERCRELGIDHHLPAAFDDWFARCVNRDPAQRFESAGNAVTALARIFHIELAPMSLGRESVPHVVTVLSAPTPFVARSSTAEGISLSGTSAPAKRTPLVIVALLIGMSLLVAAGVTMVFLRGRATAPEAHPEQPTTVSAPAASAMPVVEPQITAASATASATSSVVSAPEPAAIAKPKPSDGAAVPKAQRPKPTTSEPQKDEGLYGER